MRLWSLHPRYLDPQGLVALWREGLLARAVLAGHTRGYTRHPQLARFRASVDPLGYIDAYLAAVHAEATRRDYAFDLRKLGAIRRLPRLRVTRGQLDHEWAHLNAKLQARAPDWWAGLADAGVPQPHPLFARVPGGVADWEVAAHRRT